VAYSYGVPPRKKQSPTQISVALREAVAAAPDSLRSLAADTGIDVSHLSRWMRGERDLTLAHVDALCARLGLRLARRN
jgi:transcriptional regulator with XRE-family HTH domain